MLKTVEIADVNNPTDGEIEAFVNANDDAIIGLSGILPDEKTVKVRAVTAYCEAYGIIAVDDEIALIIQDSAVELLEIFEAEADSAYETDLGVYLARYND